MPCLCPLKQKNAGWSVLGGFFVGKQGLSVPQARAQPNRRHQEIFLLHLVKRGKPEALAAFGYFRCLFQMGQPLVTGVLR